MKFLKLFSDVIIFINTLMGKLVSYVIFILVILTVLEVCLRRIFNSPTIWSFEISLQLFGLNFMIAAAFTLLRDGHVSVDILHSKLNEKSRAYLDILCYFIFFFPFTIGVLIKGYEYAKISWMTNETSWSVFAAPLYPIKTVIPLSFLLLILQGITIIIDRILLIRKLNGDHHD